MGVSDGAGLTESAQVSSDRDDDRRTTLWIFHGEQARFASGLFVTADEGLAWAADNHLTGILTEYPVGGTYDIAIREGRFTPSRPHHGTPEHVAGFSPGLRHFHLVDGCLDR